MDPTKTKRSKKAKSQKGADKDVEPTEKKSKQQMKDKRKSKLSTKVGKRGNFAAAGLVGLGAMINYVSVGNGPACVADFDEKNFETSFEPTSQKFDSLVNIGDMFIQEDENELTLEEVFNSYEVYKSDLSTALMKTEDMPPAVPNSSILGRKDEFSL